VTARKQTQFKANCFETGSKEPGLKKQSQFYAGHISVKSLIAMVYRILSVGAGKKTKPILPFNVRR